LGLPRSGFFGDDCQKIIDKSASRVYTRAYIAKYLLMLPIIELTEGIKQLEK
jgi:hypothetical protein